MEYYPFLISVVKYSNGCRQHRFSYICTIKVQCFIVPFLLIPHTSSSVCKCPVNYIISKNYFLLPLLWISYLWICVSTRSCLITSTSSQPLITNYISSIPLEHLFLKIQATENYSETWTKVISHNIHEKAKTQISSDLNM